MNLVRFEQLDSGQARRPSKRTMNNSTETFNTSCYFYPVFQRAQPPGKYFIFKVVLLSILMASGLVCNALVVAVIVKNKHLRKSINCFILSMAISDLLIPTFAIPPIFAVVVVGSPKWLGGLVGSVLCKLVNFLSELSPLISNMSLVFMTWDRFIAIVYPTKFHLRTPTCRKRLVILSWLIPTIYCSKNFYSYKIISHSSFVFCGQMWSPDFPHDETNTKVLTIYSVAFLYIPFILLTFMYSAIICTLRKQQLILKNNITCTLQQNVRQKQRRRVITLALAIVVGFIICYGPLNYIYVMQSLKGWLYDSSASTKMTFFSLALGYSNATVNPLICMIFHKDLRVCVMKIICCQLKCFRSNKTFNLRPNYELNTLDLDKSIAVTTSSIKNLSDIEVTASTH